MSFLLTQPALVQLFERLLPDYRIMAPAAEYRGGRFSDTDNVTYHSIRHPADLVWQEKSHFSPKEVVLPITQTLFHFDNLELRESKVEAKPTLLFLRSCDIHALRRLDQVYLKNGQNSDVYYARLRSKLRPVRYSSNPNGPNKNVAGSAATRARRARLTASSSTRMRSAS